MMDHDMFFSSLSNIIMPKKGRDNLILKFDIVRVSCSR